MDAARLIRLLSCAAAVLALAPAAASAQSLSEDDCREATTLRATCVGLGKLGERVSAECRRAGIVDDATCWSRIGRRVVREEVAAFEGSWLARTLQFQQDLGDTLPFSEAPWAGTHNSYNSTSEPPTLSHTDSNQQLDMRDQLRLGMRSLEIDLKWMPSLAEQGADAVVVCHGQGDAGCTTERRLADRLPEITGWLDEHPDEVLLIYFEDGIGDEAGYRAAAGLVAEAFGERLYRPAGEGCQDLPLTLTREQVRRANGGRARVVVVGGCGAGPWAGISHDWPASVRHEDRPRGFTAETCRGLPHHKLVRFYEDSTFVSPAAEPTGFSSTDDGLRPDTVRTMVACGVDLLGFDQILPGDGRLDAMAWSWAENEPSAAGACEVQRADARWESRSCTEQHLPACRAADGSWVVMKHAVPREAAHSRCTDAGLEPALPRTGRQNAELRTAAPAGATLWLADA